jgi:hypothetical protein
MDFAKMFDPNEKPLENIVTDGGFCGIFRTIGCVGDSLSSGEFQTKKADGSWRYTDMFEYSWGQFMARTIGSKVYNFSKGGMTAKRYYTEFAEKMDYWNPEYACQAYTIALGVNDQKESLCPVGDVSNVSADEAAFTDTYAGYYCAIIRKLKTIQKNAKFFLITPPLNNDPARTERILHIRDIIFRVAEVFENCYVMDLTTYSPAVDDLQKEKFWLHGHLNPCGYVWYAKIIMSYMDYIIRHNIQDFNYVGFIGKEELLEG